MEILLCIIVILLVCNMGLSFGGNALVLTNSALHDILPPYLIYRTCSHWVVEVCPKGHNRRYPQGAVILLLRCCCGEDSVHSVKNAQHRGAEQ